MGLIISALAIPIMVLNTLGVIVASIWLIVLGEWGGLALGQAALFFGSFFCGTVILPGIIFAILAMFLHGKGPGLRFLGYLIGMIGVLWTYLVMTLLGLFAFGYFTGRSDSDSFIPYLLLAYGVATGPWAYMASQEDNEFSAISTFFLQIACAIQIVTVGFTDLSYLAITLVFAGIMLAGFIVNLVLGGVLALMEARSQRHMF